MQWERVAQCLAKRFNLAVGNMLAERYDAAHLPVEQPVAYFFAIALLELSLGQANAFQHFPELAVAHIAARHAKLLPEHFFNFSRVNLDTVFLCLENKHLLVDHVFEHLQTQGFD